jgi:nicotinamide mononucleotide transporter
MENKEEIVIDDKKKEKKVNKFVTLWKYFTTYEKIWFISLFVLTILSMFLIPEESANGVSGIIITTLYVLDVILALVCELLTSKQSRWSFFIYIFVELIEISTMIILKARFASMAISVLFWTPMHIISFVNWNRHKDKVEKDKTVVRNLKWWQDILIMTAVAIWTVGIGYLMAAYGPETDFYSSDKIEKAVAYLDACMSALSITNGVLLLFRFKENWIVWFGYVILETIVNIMTGQWILLILKVGYFTNTTYGYIKWTKYIKAHSNEDSSLKNDDSNNQISNGTKDVDEKVDIPDSEIEDKQKASA